MNAKGKLKKLAMEPPFRLLVRAALRAVPASASTRALWDLADRPPYLVGMLHAARRALREGVGAISVIEFGVAGGNGLLSLEREAEAVERELGVSIQVYGFDNGPAGLPAFIGDHRDHPDKWKPGDFPMDEPLLRSKLGRRTTLVLGDVAETVPRFFDDPSVPPVGFVAFDLDLYSSTAHALRVLSMPARRTLDHVPVYFDDTEHSVSHRFAGELLAIDEFNEANAHVKIDRWRGIHIGRPFPEAPFLQKMYMAHNLEAISSKSLDRDPLHRSLPRMPQTVGDASDALDTRGRAFTDPSPVDPLRPVDATGWTPSPSRNSPPSSPTSRLLADLRSARSVPD